MSLLWRRAHYPDGRPFRAPIQQGPIAFCCPQKARSIPEKYNCVALRVIVGRVLAPSM